MKMSRETNLLLNKVLNDYLPPVVRDQRWFGWLMTRALYRDKAPIYMNFHERAYTMSDAEFAQVYADIQLPTPIRDTDLNRASVDLILENITGESGLEVACGRGYLCERLAEKPLQVTACDIVLKKGLAERFPQITFVETPAEKLPFADDAFDTVICTHMLEHVRDLSAVLAELRRVTRRRLIIVVPCERAHLYTPSLHLHFFPYRYSLLLAFKPKSGHYMLRKAGGDWFYTEDKKLD